MYRQALTRKGDVLQVGQMGLKFWCLTAVLFQLLAGCTSDPSPPRELVFADIVVTRDDPTAPAGCAPADVAQFVIRFLDHLETGNVDVDRFFVPTDRFSWYSAVTGDARGGEGHRFWGRSLDRLPGYFRKRHHQQERMELKKIWVDSGRSGRSQIANVVFELRRTANDLGKFGVDHEIATGKGGIDCGTDRIIQWSVFQPEQPDGSTANLCPEPSVPASDKAVACGPE